MEYREEQLRLVENSINRIIIKVTRAVLAEAITRYLEFVKEKCLNNPDYATGFSLGVRKHKLKIGISELQGVGVGDDDYRIKDWKQQLAMIETQYVTARTNPNTMQGWYEAEQKAHELEKTNYNYVKGYAAEELFEHAFLNPETE
jgi:hypothetical protein